MMRKPLRSQLRLWEKLSTVKYRRREGLFLAEGYKVVNELINSTWEPRAIMILGEKRHQWDTFLSTVDKSVDIYELSKKDWNTLTQDKESEGIIALVAMPRHIDIMEALIQGAGHMVLLYRISNPNNLGAILRTVHWFGIGTVVLSAGSVDFTNPKVVRAAMGGLFHLSVVQDVDFEKVLPRIREHFFLVGGNNREGVTPHACAQRTALLMGSESHGLPDTLIRLAHEQWHIPGAGKGESLSLPQAAAIMIYECTKRGH